MNNGKANGQFVVAIDGPAGSGKSTTAKLVAARLGFQYLDTGAMYRALTVLAMREKIASGDGERLGRLAAQMDIRFETTDQINRVFVGNEEVTAAIRTPDVTREVSEVSAHRAVREAMVARQQAIGARGKIVAEGRDTTTVVFPQAQVKVFLLASVTERARRRLLELERMGVRSSATEQEADLVRRDSFDSGRAHSPLTQAPDAVVIDTTALTIEEQVVRILELVTAASV